MDFEAICLCMVLVCFVWLVGLWQYFVGKYNIQDKGALQSEINMVLECVHKSDWYQFYKYKAV